jgi:glycosidase
MHVRKSARDALFPSREDDVFFAPRRGDVVLRGGPAMRAFANRVNRGERRSPEEQLRPAELGAMTLLHEILHTVIKLYRERHPDSFERLAASLEEVLGEEAREVVVTFVGAYPPPPVYHALRGESDDTPQRYLDRTSLEREIDEELILLWVTNENPAYAPVKSLVRDDDLPGSYRAFVATAQEFFENEPRFGPRGETLLELLRAPGRKHPSSILEQVDYVETEWTETLDLGGFTTEAQRLRDLEAEHGRYFRRGGPGPGEPLLEAMTFRRRPEDEPAQFSPDVGWMPNVVLLAKSAYVWLDQLSKTYGREVKTLDQIPDEELDRIASLNVNGLWLIGIFERSRASRKVKQMHGDADALASAYSLASYEIASDLGGYDAYANLRGRAWYRGIRLAADMVPNHVGIDGDWVIDRPDYFLQTRVPPFPSYRFGGPDLSDHPRVGIYLEEGYWSRTDAAVVFRRNDRLTGEDRFIYHGNDGTSTPWNDTAQLDYTKAEVRAAVIDRILHVARMFPIIRFDAAMTLAKRHIQRLWFPLPGGGADAIPSRVDFAMTEEEFDRAIPVEFWREVVDTVAAHAPETLLLAEAFWMMEGYFVRTLGMHRVYNSAFMNMLKRGENEKYRATITNVLDFDPEILKRFVNFMNNPDEDTAIAQFGDNDRYFGVCTMMVTMPGLPMFGHGQIEGFREKYGMEYRRARFDERPNPYLVDRHYREIVPLLRKRYLFSGVERFALYDFMTGGGPDSDVFAYSNGAGSERALVLFNNAYKTTLGRIYASTHRSHLAHELGLDDDHGWWLVFRDVPRGLDYIRPTKDVVDGGMTWELGGFQYHVLMDFRHVTATLERPYDRLAAELNGRGVPDIELAVRELYLRPVHAPLREACSSGHLAYLASLLDAEAMDDAALRDAIGERLGHVVDGLDWMLTQRSGRDVTIDRGPTLDHAAARFVAIRGFLGAAKPEEPIEEVPAEPVAEEVEEVEAETPAPTTLTSVLHVDLLLATLQVEAVLELLAAGDDAFEEARSRPPAYLSARGPIVFREPIDSDPDAAQPPPDEEAAAPEKEEEQTPLSQRVTATGADLEAAEDEVPDAEPTEPDLPAPSLGWSERETLIEKWHLATAILEAFGDSDEAKRRTALVLLAATLPTGPLASAVRLALGTRRGQTFLNVHEYDGAYWLTKERFEDLARFLAEREASSGRVDEARAAAEVAELVALANAEGYRADRMAAKLGPPPAV